MTVLDPTRSKHWIEQHRWLVLAIVAVVTLFLIGLGLHEAGVMTPLDGFYESWHMRVESWLAGFRWTILGAVNGFRWT